MSVNILNDNEIRYKNDPYDFPKNERGSHKKRIDKKIKEIDVTKLIIALQELSDEQKEYIIKELLNSIDKDGYKLNIISDINNDKKPLEKKLNYLLKKNQLNNLIAIKKIKPLTNEEKNLLVFNEKFNLNDLKGRKRILSKLYKSENFILYRKLNDDVKFIFENKTRKKVWGNILKVKKTNLKRLLDKFPKYTIEGLYERGIIIQPNLPLNRFIKICKIHSNGKYVDRGKFKYLITPFKIPSDITKEVILNPYYSQSNINYEKSVNISFLIKGLKENLD